MNESDRLNTAYGGGRLTPPRRAIARAVEEMPGAFSVEDLASALRKTSAASGAVATVYRAVAAMEAAGFLERVGARDGATLYARCSSLGEHHHHVVCDACGRTARTSCPVLASPVADDGSGFVVTRHEITLYGLCPDCAKKRDH